MVRKKAMTSLSGQARHKVVIRRPGTMAVVEGAEPKGKGPCGGELSHLPGTVILKNAESYLSREWLNFF